LSNAEAMAELISLIYNLPAGTVRDKEMNFPGSLCNDFKLNSGLAPKDLLPQEAPRALSINQTLPGPPRIAGGSFQFASNFANKLGNSF